MNALSTQLMLLKLIGEEPLNRHQKWKTYIRYFAWQLLKRSGLNLPYTFFENCRIRVKHRFSNSSACAYTGLPEFDCKAFLLHLLRPADLMVDAGANIGVYSIIAAKACGARVLAFEPEPEAFAELEANIALNETGGLVRCYPLALGGEPETMRITSRHGVQNHLTEMEDESEPGIPVEVHPLDDFCEEEAPLLIKIDVEGFEARVVWGALITLTRPAVKAIIMERMGLGERYGLDEDALHENLLKLGFKCFDYQPFTRSLVPVEKTTVGNYFYIRDMEFVKDRLAAARKFTCRGKEF